MPASYRVPGAPTPPPPPTQPNSYRTPVGSLQDSGQNQHQPAPLPAPQPPPRAQDVPHRVLLDEWRVHHGSDWVRADELHSTIRRLVDAKDRTAAIRQKLRQLAATCRELETKSVGNAARPVTFYRLIQSETA